MGNFYNPPPFTQGAVNSTLPVPHDPIPAQGDQPPRLQTAAVLAMMAVLASWPADLEPRLARPNDQRVTIAPLTLSYGAAPQPQSGISVTELAQIVSTWVPAWTPPRALPSSAWNVPVTAAGTPIYAIQAGWGNL